MVKVPDQYLGDHRFKLCRKLKIFCPTLLTNKYPICNFLVRIHFLANFYFIFSFLLLFSAETEAVAVVQRKTLGKAEVTFLGVFVFAVLVIAVLLFIVFTKLRRHHKLLPPSSSGSSSTSESTLRSTGTSSPLDDEVSSSEPLKGFHNQRTKRDRRRSSHRKRTRRTEFLCDADHVPRCTCGEISELDSASGSNSASDFSPIKVNNTVERVLVRSDVECDCPECLRYERYAMKGCPEFRAPEKKYYGDWMLTEMPAETTCPKDERIYRDSCKVFV